MSTVLRTALLCAVLAVSALAAVVLTTSNTIPASNVGRQQLPITANSLKPAQCASLNLSGVVTNGNGTTGNDLILATNLGSTLNGNGGVDCFVGGTGADTFNANGAHAGDVCIGGGGADRFRQCQTQF